jgi:hypothetical protein
MKDLWEYDGKYVKLVTTDGRIYNGVCSSGTDYETEEDYLDFYMSKEGTIHEIMASEIKTIEIIEE